ncbi:hypothetical protein [Bacillus sp. M6-12]|uniref:hypothetical protein n=1 Tax=Bacillus sp. M6-12 TaxID=2054166 RepID=UPI0015E082AC|nr:hypothetical protein [Bacillus sp. M6-12]
MESKMDYGHFLINRELGRLLIDLTNCNDIQVRDCIYQDILLLRQALVLTAI